MPFLLLKLSLVSATMVFAEQAKKMPFIFVTYNMVWPQSIGIATDNINAAPFLSPSQKRDILFNNAARYLRLSKEEIQQMHE